MKLGVVGCGLVGRKRALAARDHRIVAVADVDAERARSLAAETGARAVSDAREVIASDVDLVIVATTHDRLAQIALAAVDSGRHVLVEKPAGRTAAEVEPLAAAARRSGRVVKVGFNHRFHPGLQRAKQIVASGALGPLLWVRGRYGHGGRPGYEREWRCDPERSGGGEAIDQGSHLVDLARFMLGDLALEYAALPTYFWNVPVEDNCFLALRGARGEMAWLHASWTEWKNTFCFEVCGRDGKVVVDGLGGSYGVESATHYAMSKEMGPPATTRWEWPFPDDSWRAELVETQAAIEERRRPLGDVEDALAMLRILDAARAMRSAGPGRGETT